MPRCSGLTVTINRSDLETVMMGMKSLRAQIADGTAKAEGDEEILAHLAETLAVFTPSFEMLPGTAATGAAPSNGNPYEVDQLELRGE